MKAKLLPMNRRAIHSRAVGLLLTLAAAMLLVLTGCSKKSGAQVSEPAHLQVEIKTPFHFVAYGDTRFHDPKDTEAANSAVRVALVQAVADTNPSFICFTGDIVYNGYDVDDWKVFDRETSVWREMKIPVYPALGNHDLHGSEKVALGNYFERFPSLQKSRYYSMRAANTLLLVLDSSLEETMAPQGQWLTDQLDHVPSDVDFVFVMDHHPPYTSSSDAKVFGGGHSARKSEQALANMLEDRQAHAHFRIVVFSGHVHNYERHEHGGVTYFVSGGGAAHAYPIERAKTDLFQSKEINYHYLLVEVNQHQLTITMNRLDLTSGKPVWTKPDSVTITTPVPPAGTAAGH